MGKGRFGKVTERAYGPLVMRWQSQSPHFCRPFVWNALEARPCQEPGRMVMLSANRSKVLRRSESIHIVRGF